MPGRLFGRTSGESHSRRWKPRSGPLSFTCRDGGRSDCELYPAADFRAWRPLEDTTCLADLRADARIKGRFLYRLLQLRDARRVPQPFRIRIEVIFHDVTRIPASTGDDCNDRRQPRDRPGPGGRPRRIDGRARVAEALRARPVGQAHRLRSGRPRRRHREDRAQGRLPLRHRRPPLLHQGARGRGDVGGRSRTRTS